MAAAVELSSIFASTWLLEAQSLPGHTASHCSLGIWSFLPSPASLCPVHKSLEGSKAIGLQLPDTTAQSKETCLAMGWMGHLPRILLTVPIVGTLNP